MELLEKEHVVKGPHELIPGSGVNLDRYSVLDFPTGDEVHFVFIARIVKQKGIEQYLDMAHAIKAKYPNTVFHICGNCTPEYEQRIKREVEEGAIIYHGRIPDVTVVHKISSCTILPSFYPEGMNNVLLESCSVGRPIITTDRPGCGEVVDDGVNGFVVKQKDSADLIEKVERFLSLSWEQRRDMGLAGRKKVEREFSREIVVKKYLEEINKA
jgi:galacturonosyltransferase